VSTARLVITAVVVEGRPVAQVAAGYGVSRQWIYKLLARYRVEGEEAFEPHSRRPHNKPTAIPVATVELIIKLRLGLTRQGLDAGAHTIAWHLTEQHQLTVSPATIWRILKRARLITPEPNKKPPNRPTSVSPPSSPTKYGRSISPTIGSPDPTAHPAPTQKFCAS